MRPPRLLIGILLFALAGAAHAQGVGINATGAAADTSAILDLSATNKGFLPPRMTSAQRTAIVQPATGLLVYQTDGAAGLWYNAGTSGAPSWKQVMDATAGTGPWSLNGASAYYLGGNVGVGTSAPTHRLNVIDNLNGLRVQTNAAGSALASFGGVGTIQVDAPGVAGGRLSLLENGNLGLGVVSPTSKLSFAAVAGKKISLYPAGANDYGFGISAGRLQIFSDGTPSGDVAIGTDAAGTFTERLAVKNTGALAVSGSTGTAGQVLQSNGSGAAATWVSPTRTLYDNLTFVSSTQTTTVAMGASTLLNDLSRTVAVTGNAKLVIEYSLRAEDSGCVLCSEAIVDAEIWLDGVRLHSESKFIPNGRVEEFDDRFVALVGAGSHLVEIKGHAFDRSAVFGSTNSNFSSTLGIQVIPQ